MLLKTFAIVERLPFLFCFLVDQLFLWEEVDCREKIIGPKKQYWKNYPVSRPNEQFGRTSNSGWAQPMSQFYFINYQRVFFRNANSLNSENLQPQRYGTPTKRSIGKKLHLVNDTVMMRSLLIVTLTLSPFFTSKHSGGCNFLWRRDCMQPHSSRRFFRIRTTWWNCYLFTGKVLAHLLVPYERYVEQRIR